VLTIVILISDKCTCFIYRINEHMVRLFYNYNNDKIIYSTIYIYIHSESKKYSYKEIFYKKNLICKK